jgi:hypothetical protein
MNRYVHENSPHDEIFKGIRSYEEVQDRFQTLSLDQQASFLSFQRRGRNSLPKLLQGELIAAPPAQESIPPGFEPGHSGKKNIEENLRGSKVLTHELEASLSGHLRSQALEKIKSYIKWGLNIPPLMPTTPVGTSSTIEQQNSIEIGTHITSLTPLQSSFRNPSSEIIFVSDLIPISPK